MESPNNERLMETLRVSDENTGKKRKYFCRICKEISPLLDNGIELREWGLLHLMKHKIWFIITSRIYLK